MPVPLHRNREYSALWIGQAVSNLGISVSSFAYPLVVLTATGSAAKAGLVATVLAATAFVLRLPAGALADRWNRKRILVLCDAGRAVNAAAFAAALATGRFFYPQVLAVAFVEAALGVLFGPAEAAAVRRVVPVEQIGDAVAANQSRSALPGLVGPPLGGALLSVGRAFPFAADAVSYMVSLACVVLVRTPLQEERPSGRRAGAVSSILDGLLWIRGQRLLRSLLLLYMGFGFVFSSTGLVILVLARNRGASPSELGLMFAITAAGGVGGALAAPRLLRRLRPRACVVTFGWVAAATTLSLTLLHSPYAIGAAGAVAFFLIPAVNALAFGIVARDAPDALQGRATSAAIQVTSFAAPAGPVLAGVLVSSTGPVRALVVYTAVLAGLAMVATLSGALRADADQPASKTLLSDPST